MSEASKRGTPDLSRVVVIGVSGAGKSTISERLAEALDVPRIHIDSIYWAPGSGRHITDAEFVSKIDEATHGERWIVDGNYIQVREMIWERATAILWLNYSFLRVYKQVMGRTFQLLRKPSGTGRISIRKAFFHKHSPWWLVPATFRKRRREYRERFESGAADGRSHIEHRTPAETSRLLESLTGQVQPPA